MKRVVAVAIVITISCSATSCASDQEEKRIRAMLIKEGLYNIDLVFDRQWLFEADAYQGCRVSGFESFSSGKWILVGYNEITKRAGADHANWPPVGIGIAKLAMQYPENLCVC